MTTEAEALANILAWSADSSGGRRHFATIGVNFDVVTSLVEVAI